jgi:hypothetical protein
MATSTLGSGTLVLAGTTSGTTTVTATAVAGTTTLTLPAATDTLVGKATTDTLTNKTLTGAVMNGTLGATTPSTVAATTLTTSSTVTHNGGTANGVAYLDGSKVLTTGSALVFDGTNLGLGVTPSSWATYKAIDILGYASFSSYNGNEADMSTNAYYNAGWKYKNTAAATLYQQDTGVHRWQYAASGTAGNAITWTAAMTLDASGNLGIGTTSPYSAADARSIHLSASLYPLLEFSSTSAPSDEKNWRFIGRGISSTGVFQLQSMSDDNASETNVWEVKRSTGRSIEYQRFFTGAASEAMRLDSSGNLLVGTTSGISGFRLNVGSSTTTNNSAILRNDGTQTLSFSLAAAGLTTKAISATTDGRVYIFSNADTATGQYMTSGGTSWNATSDERLKENLTPITDAVNKVSTLRAVVGNYISDENKTPTPFLIAQDVQSVLPEAVDASNENELGLSYTGMIPLLVAAIKEQQALITQLTARITALEGA